MIGVARRRQHGAGSKALTAPVLTGTNVTTAGSGTSGNVTVPATALVGDIILVCATGAPASAPSTPAGYALVTTVSVAAAGSFLGTVMYVFSKVAVAGDIGAALTITGMSGSWPWSLVARTYTAGAVDSSAGAATNGTPLAPPALTSSMASETMVTFGAVLHQSSSNAGDGFAAGGSHVTSQNNTGGHQWSGVEDWALATSGLSSTGGNVQATSQGFPSLVAVSVILKPSGA